MKHTVKVSKLQGIHATLVRLGEQKLPIGYELAKNIRRCDQALAETNDVVKALVRKLAVKDKSGEPTYQVRGDRMFPIFGDNDAVYAAEIRKVDDDFVEIDFHRILISRIEGIPIEGSLLAPLLGYVFVDTMEDPAPVERDLKTAA